MLFRFGNELVRIERNCSEASLTSQLTKEKLRYQLRRMANFFRVHDGEAVLQDPPARLIEDMLAEPEPPLPTLRAITDVPIFASDGTLISVPGYHPDSGIYYRPALGLAVPSVPDQPGESEVEKAKRVIDDVLCDFPFASEADRAHAIGLMLLPFVRELIAGPTPLTLIDAPTYGSGKGLLAQVCLAPGCSELAFLAPGQDDNELRKMITSALLEYKRVLVLDNVTQLRSPVLAMAITASRWQDRLLGVNHVVSFPARCIWVATGNNVQLSGEIMRRCVWIRLLPPCERPWTREPNQFRHPCLIDYVKRHRAKLVWAALTMVQNWLASGKPSFSGRPLGSFEAWSRTVGGILQAAGIAGFLENQNEFYESADEDSLTARCFVQSWWETYQIQPVLAAALVSLAKDCELLPAQSDDPCLARRLGRWLSKNEGRVFSNYRITRAGVHQRAILWRLSPTEGTRPRYSTGDLDTGAGDVDDPFGEDDPLQADGSPLTGDCDSVPASMRGGTNSPNSLNSPISGDTIPGDTNPASELSELSEFLSPSQKRVLTPTGDNANSGLTDISPCKSKTCAGDTIPGDRNPPLGTGDTNPAGDTIPSPGSGDTNPGDTIPGDRNPPLGTGDTNPAGDTIPSPGSGQLTDTERELLAWLRRQDKPVTLRDVQRGLRAMRRQNMAMAALEKIVALGLGEWESTSTGGRGRTVRRFRLTQPAAEPEDREAERATDIGTTAPNQEPAPVTEPGTATPTATPTEDAESSAEVEPALELAPELAPLEILDRAMRLPTEWRERFWQVFDAVGRCPLPDRAMQAYRRLLTELPRELRPILATAPQVEPNRPDNAVIVAMMAKLSPELQRRFWQLYDRYAGKYPRKELPWLAWQELQREITQDTDPDTPQDRS
jgi:hypothetical protein